MSTQTGVRTDKELSHLDNSSLFVAQVATPAMQALPSFGLGSNSGFLLNPEFLPSYCLRKAGLLMHMCTLVRIVAAIG